MLQNKQQATHVISEIVVLLGLIYYFSKKNRKLLLYIEDLSTRIEKQEDIIQKHDQILTKVVGYINNGNSNSTNGSIQTDPITLPSTLESLLLEKTTNQKNDSQYNENKHVQFSNSVILPGSKIISRIEQMSSDDDDDDDDDDEKEQTYIELDAEIEEELQELNEEEELGEESNDLKKE
jgi:hypothetical protein